MIDHTTNMNPDAPPTNITNTTNTTPTINSTTDINTTNNPPNTIPPNHITNKTIPHPNNPNQHALHDPTKSTKPTNRALFDISFSQITNWGDFEISDDEPTATNKRKDHPPSEQPHPKCVNMPNPPPNTLGQNNTKYAAHTTTPTTLTTHLNSHSPAMN
jgi:hypothetical protein